MKTREQVLQKIKSLQLDLDSLHEERDRIIDEYGGIDQMFNEDLLTDIGTVTNNIKMLEWVLS